MFTVQGSQAVPAESYWPMSVISGQSFTVSVSASDSTYSGTADVYANSPTDDLAYKIGTVTLTNGFGTSDSLTIKSVFGSDSYRKITVTDHGANSGSIDTGVWFQTTMTVECLNPDYNNHQLACGQTYTTKQQFAALPSTGLCGRSVAIHSTTSGAVVSVPVQDVGPMTTTDPYWNNSGVPLYPTHGIDGSDGTWDALGLGTKYQCSAPAYGSETVQWRFT